MDVIDELHDIICGQRCGCEGCILDCAPCSEKMEDMYKKHPDVLIREAIEMSGRTLERKRRARYYQYLIKFLRWCE